MSTSNIRSKDEAEIRELMESWAKAARNENLEGILARSRGRHCSPGFRGRGSLI